MCEGSNTMVLMDKETPNKLYCVKTAGPLWVGQLPDERGYIVASEVAVFQNYTNKYFEIAESSIIELDLDENSTHYEIKTLVAEKIETTLKQGYRYWLEQEIFEQAEASSRALNYGSRITTGFHNKINLGGLEANVMSLK